MKDEYFESLWQGLYDELDVAARHFDIFWLLYDSSYKYPDVMDEYIQFFYYTLFAHDTSFIIGIHNVIYSKHKLVCFTNLFKHIKTESFREVYSKPQLAKWQEQFDEYRRSNLVKFIQAQRNKQLAHRELNFERMKEIPVYKRDEALSLLKGLRTILGEIKFGYNHRINTPIARYKCDELIEALHEYRLLKGKGLESA